MPNIIDKGKLAEELRKLARKGDGRRRWSDEMDLAAAEAVNAGGGVEEAAIAAKGAAPAGAPPVSLSSVQHRLRELRFLVKAGSACVAAAMLCSCSSVSLASVGMDMPAEESESASGPSPMTLRGARKWVVARASVPELDIATLPVVSGSVDSPGDMDFLKANATLENALAMACAGCSDKGATDVVCVEVDKADKAAFSGQNEIMQALGCIIRVKTVEVSVAAAVPELENNP